LTLIKNLFPYSPVPELVEGDEVKTSFFRHHFAKRSGGGKGGAHSSPLRQAQGPEDYNKVLHFSIVNRQLGTRRL